MRVRWLLTLGVASVGLGVANGQPTPAAPLPLPAIPAVPVTPPAPPALPTPAPTQLPPLLQVPAPPNEPLAEVPRPGPAPAIEYDPGYQYLPERLPERSRRHSGEEVCGPPGKWWVTPSLELSWVQSDCIPTNVRLRIPNPVSLGGTLPGPVVPVAGQDSGRFEAALGLVVGRWFGDTNTHGVEASLYLRDANTTFGGAAPGFVVVFPRGPDQSTAQVIPFPEPFAPLVVGTFPATLGTFFATVDVNYRHKLLCTDNYRLDALAGYRYAFLGDELYLGELPDNQNDYKKNRVAVSNNFHGGQVGLAGEVRANGWYLSGSAKLAFGGTTADVTTAGLFTGAEGRLGNRYRRLGALTAAEQTEFAVMPTFNVQLGRQLTDRARVFVGYSFSSLSHVARLDDALDPPSSSLSFTDFWVQSIGFGGSLRF